MVNNKNILKNQTTHTAGGPPLWTGYQDKSDYRVLQIKWHVDQVS